MKIFAAAALAGPVAAAILLGGEAAAAPTGPSDVDSTVAQLKSQGYNVIVNRTGAAPMSSCMVSGVRPGQLHETNDSRGGGSINQTIISETVFVDVKC